MFDDGHHKFALAWYFMGNPEEVHSYIHRTQRKDGVFGCPIIDFISVPEWETAIGGQLFSELEISGYYYAQMTVEITGTHDHLDQRRARSNR